MNEQELNEQLNTAGQSVVEGLDDEPEIVEEPIEEIETEEEEDDGYEPEPETPQVQAKSEKSTRFQTLANERKAAQAEAALLKQQLELQRQQMEQLQRTQTAKEEEFLDPDEKWRRDANRAIQQVQFQAQESADKATFVSTISRDPVLSKYGDAVEAKLQEFRSRNVNMPRDAVLTIVMGEAAREAAKKVPAAKREGQARVSAARGQPIGSKSNVATSKSSQSAYERLKDIPI